MKSMGIPGEVIVSPMATRLRLRAYQDRGSLPSASRAILKSRPA